MLARAEFVELAQAEFDAAVEHHQVEANMGGAFTREVRRAVELAMQFPDSGTLASALSASGSDRRCVAWHRRERCSSVGH